MRKWPYIRGGRLWQGGTLRGGEIGDAIVDEVFGGSSSTGFAKQGCRPR